MAIFKPIKGNNDPVPIHTDENPNEVKGSSETKTILPSTVEVEIPVRGTGNEIEKKVPGNIKAKRTISSVQNFIDMTIGTSQLARDLGDVGRGINSIVNDVKGMLSDPRYAIFKVGELLKGQNVTWVHDDVGPLSNGSSKSQLNKYLSDLLDQYKTKKAIEPTDETVQNRVSPPKLWIGTSSTAEEDVHSISEVGVDADNQPYVTTTGFKYVPALCGYKSVSGLSIGTSHLWDVKISNYFHEGKYKSFAPPVPVVCPVANAEYDNYVPVLAYTIDDYATKSTDVELENDSKIEVVIGLQRNNTLTLTFLEDDNYTWTRYFDWYLTNIYDRNTHTIAPYKQSCLKIEIAVYNTKNHIHFYYKLLCIPISFGKRIEGTSDIGEFGDVTINFSIVGDIPKW